MARPKTVNKKVRINLTVSSEVKHMADLIRVHNGVSISELLEECIRKEFKKLQKSIKNLPEPELPGQTDITDYL